MTAPRIPVESWLTPQEARTRYARTIVHDADMIRDTLAADPDLRERMAGRSWHVGRGEWLTVCGYCDAYALTLGPMPLYATLGPHMVADHAARVPGINVGILP